MTVTGFDRSALIYSVDSSKESLCMARRSARSSQSWGSIGVCCKRKGFFCRVSRSCIKRLSRSMSAWCPDRSTPGTSLSLQTAGRVYCGHSSRPSENESILQASSSGSTPGMKRLMASIMTVAANSPPVKMKLPIDTSSTPICSSARRSTP